MPGQSISYRPPLTQLGWVTLVVGATTLVGGYVFGWLELTVVAIGCTVTLLMGLLAVIGRIRVDLHRLIRPTEVTVGERAVGVVTISNPTRWTHRRLVVQDKVADRVVPLNIGSIKGGAAEEILYDLPTSTRGLRQVGPADVVRTDPLGLFRRARPSGGVVSYRVWPRRIVLPVVASGMAMDLDGPTSDFAPEGGLAFHAIRQYVPGDDSRLIHWRSTAKSGGQTLMVRQFVDNRRPQQIVALDASPVYGSERFELAVEIAASLVESCHQASVPCLLTTVDGQAASDGLRVAMDRLAEVRMVEGDALAALTSSTSRISNGACSVAFVTGASSMDQVLRAVQPVPAAALELIRVVDDPGDVRIILPRTRVIEVDSLTQFEELWRMGRR
ncbi:MAG: DUF58 domain-containing protein [Actinomycetia bacterium]|nr:DUF58 domain-containing protein [Actinomycetes bacterium]MCP5025639.1 DUF58 domain-containing protein [Actinomycetes bacterium]